MALKFKKSRLKQLSFLFITTILLIFIIISINLFAQVEQQIQQPQNSGGVISFNFNSISSVTDLSFNRSFDKINITWNGKNSYVTMRIDFYSALDGKRYSVAQAQSFGARFNDWIVSNSGNSLKWGGIANVSGVSPVIKTNGFYPVFELIESQNADITKDGDKLWLDNNVYIEWKDNNNPLNIFKVWNRTTVYLTNNNGLFHNTIIYDPTINVTSGNRGVFNGTIYNDTTKGIQQNNSNGTYVFPVFNISINGSIMQITNITYSNSTPKGANLSFSMRTKNVSYNRTGELLNLGLDKNYTDVNFVDDYADYDLTGKLKNGIEFNNSCVVDGCYSFTGLSNKHIQVPNFPETENMTCMAWIKTKSIGSQQILSQSGHPYFSQFYLGNGQDLTLSPAGVTFRNLDFDTVNGYFFTGTQQNIWAHIALTIDVVRQNYTVYKNGTFFSNRTAIPPAASGTGTLFIGVYFDGISEEFNGWIDEVKCFSRVWNKDEIKSIYDQEKDGYANWSASTAKNQSYPLKFPANRINGTLAEVTAYFDREGENSSTLYEMNISFDDISAAGEEAQVLDTTPPIINGSLNKSLSNILQFDFLNATFNATDDSLNVTNGTIAINESGFFEWYNFSFSGSEQQSFWQNFTVNCPAGCVINVTGIARDNSSNIQMNDTKFTVTTGVDACSCPASGNFEIGNGNICNITTTCDLGDNMLIVNANSGFILGSTGTLICNAYAISKDAIFSLNKDSVFACG